MQNIDRRFAAKRQPASQALVEQHTEGENVAAGVGGLTAKLFRRHIWDRATNGVSRRCASGKGLFGVIASAFAPGQDCQAKIENLHARFEIHHDIARFDIAVKNARLMRFVQSLGNLTRDLQHLRGRQRAALENLLEGFAVHEFHGDKRRL